MKYRRLPYMLAQTTIPGCLKRAMPDKRIDNKMEFENTPLYRASVQAEIEKRQGNLFKGGGH